MELLITIVRVLECLSKSTSKQQQAAVDEGRKNDVESGGEKRMSKTPVNGVVAVNAGARSH